MHLLFLKEWKPAQTERSGSKQTERSARSWSQAVPWGRNRTRGGSLHGGAGEAMGSHPALVPSPSGTASSPLTGRIHSFWAERRKSRSSGSSVGCQGESWGPRPTSPWKEHTGDLWTAHFQREGMAVPSNNSSLSGHSEVWEWSPKKRFAGFRSSISYTRPHK